MLQPIQQNESLPPVAQRAKILLDLGIPVCLVEAGGKGAFESGWQTNPIRSMDDARLQNPQYADCNVGAIAYGIDGGVWQFEIDDMAVLNRIKAETGHDLLDEFQTLVVRSRQGRGHVYFKHSAASIAMGNLAQSYVKHADFSVRTNNQYVVGPMSWRQKEGTHYEKLTSFAPAEAPQWLIDWLLAQKIEKEDSSGKEVQRNENGKIEHGLIHGWMLTQAGRLRNMGLGGNTLEQALLDLVHQNCEPPIDESKVIEMAKSVEKYEPGQAPIHDLVLNQKPDAQPRPEIDTSEGCTRPEFPYWAIMQTSIWDGLVEPALKTSSKHAEFIYMPAAQMIMNYLSGRVTIKMQTVRFNLFLGLISPYGEFFKSSSCKLAHDYCKWMGIGATLSKGLKTAEGRTLIAQAGSPEGFGLAVTTANGQHAILFNDELGKFASKAGIESSSFADDLLTWYGAGEFGNNVTSSKNSFHFEGGSYAFGWLWCTTDRGFNRHWPKLAGIASGLEDRMFFVVSPEKPKPTVMYQDPLFVEGSVETKKRIDAALAKKEYEFEDPAHFASKVAGLDPRSMELVTNLALLLTIDMGKDMIDDDVIDRALALVAYRNEAAAFLAPIEADNQQGRLQKEIIRELRQHRGKMSYRQLCLNLDYSRYGIDVWNRAYKTMLPYGNDEGIICEWQEQTTAGKRATRVVGLIKFDDEPTE